MLLLEELVVIFGTKKLPFNFYGETYEQQCKQQHHG